MLLKSGVDISRLKRQIRKALYKANNQYELYDEEMVVTSTYEGNHSAGSLHYADNAFDTRKPKEHGGEIINGIRDTCGKDFDVVAEADHLHIEYDP